MAGLPLVSLIVQRFYRQLPLYLVESVSPRLQRLVLIILQLLMPLCRTLVGQGYHSQSRAQTCTKIPLRDLAM